MSVLAKTLCHLLRRGDARGGERAARGARGRDGGGAWRRGGVRYGAKGWTFLKGVVGTVATQVESVARDNGLKLDLGAQPGSPVRPVIARWL